MTPSRMWSACTNKDNKIACKLSITCRSWYMRPSGTGASQRFGDLRASTTLYCIAVDEIAMWVERLNAKSIIRYHPSKWYPWEYWTPQTPMTPCSFRRRIWACDRYLQGIESGWLQDKYLGNKRNSTKKTVCSRTQTVKSCKNIGKYPPCIQQIQVNSSFTEIISNISFWAHGRILSAPLSNYHAALHAPRRISDSKYHKLQGEKSSVLMIACA